MRLSLALVVASSAVLAAAPRPAAADCAGPTVASSPRPGSALPPDPTLYLFVPAPAGRSPQTDVEAVAGAEALPTDVAVASRTEALTVLRIAVRTGSHRSMTLRLLGASAPWEATFTVGRARRRVPRAPVQLSAARHALDEWTCSFTDAWLLSPATEADAYRVEWAGTPTAWERGEQASAVFPRREMDLWSQRAEPGEPGRLPPSIALGHVSCFAYTIPEAAVRGPLYVKVTGLYADGGETPAWPAPRRLDADGKESPGPARHAPAPVTAPPIAAPGPAPIIGPPAPEGGRLPSSGRADSSAWPTVIVMIGLGGLLLIAAALARRRGLRVAPPPR